MVSERSKITPDTYVDAHMDSTFLVPGRDEMLDLVKANFPEEAKTEEETIAERIFDPNSEANQNAMSTADAFGVEVNPPDIGQGDAPPPLEGSEEIFSQPPPEEESQFSEAEQHKITTEGINLYRAFGKGAVLAAFETILNKPISPVRLT